jgi:hypothetical protein
VSYSSASFAGLLARWIPGSPAADSVAFRPAFAPVAGAALLTAAAVIASPPAEAVVVFLDFEGIQSSYPSANYPQILEFYNGGLSSAGTTGTNVGVSFGSNALAVCLNSTTDRCSNGSRGGLGLPTSQKGGLFFLEGKETFLNYPTGFDTGFSFNYVSLNFNGDVEVYDGLNGTGSLLATLNLTPNAGSCVDFGAEFCPFSAAGVTFAGTARSIAFGGVANQIGFDDVTFGSETPGPGPQGVPGPLGIAGAAIAFRQSRRLRRLLSLR